MRSGLAATDLQQWAEMIEARQGYRIYLKVGLAAVIIAASYFWLWNIFSGEEGRIKRFIFAGKRAAESRNLFKCAEMISPDYRDKYGNDRAALVYIAKEVFNYYRTIVIGIEGMDIKLGESGKNAEVDIVAWALCQSQDNKMDKMFEGDKGRFRVRLIKEEGKWKLSEVELLERINLMGHSIEA